MKTALLTNIMAERALMGSISGYNVPIAQASVLQDEVLEAMRDLMPGRSFYACYLDLEEGRRWHLLSDGRVDVGVIAKSMGGGGTRTLGWFLQKINFAHLIVDGPRLLLSEVEHEEPA